LEKIVVLKKQAKLKIDVKAMEDRKAHLSEVISTIYYIRHNTREMMNLLVKSEQLSSEKRAELFFEKIKPYMAHIRKHVDALECVVSDEHWDLPKYREMLFIK
ncbi:MAG: hypothetical protein V1919_01100, partial [Candidatus Omnitrophota bacterium]